MLSLGRRLLVAALLFGLVAAMSVVPRTSLASAAAVDRAHALGDEPDDRDMVRLPPRCTNDSGYPRPVRCQIKPQTGGLPIVVLWGDSHAWQLVPALERAIGRRQVGLVSFLYGGCPPMVVALETQDQRERANGCERFGNEVFDQLRLMVQRGRDVRVVLATSWELYHNVTDEPNAADERWPGLATPFVTDNAPRALTGLPRAFRALGRLGVPTDVVGQQPMVPANEDCDRLTCTQPRRAVLKDPVENNATIRAARSSLAAGRLIRPAQVLCDTSSCAGENLGVPVYFDHLHIGARTSRGLAPLFMPTVEALLASRD